MTRIAVVVLVLVALWIGIEVLWRWLARRTRAVRQAWSLWAGAMNAGPRRSAPGPAQPAGGELVRCSRCGVHIPKSRALPAKGGEGVEFYCTQDCRAQARAAVAS